MTRSLFIYWKAEREQAAAAAAAAAAVQRALVERHDGLLARLYRRADEAGVSATLMETYACAGGISAALQSEIVAAGALATQAWCQGARHVEVFDELPGAADVAVPA